MTPNATKFQRIREAIEALMQEKVCAYCHDTGRMLVNEGRGRFRNQRCVWCRDGKDKLDVDQFHPKWDIETIKKCLLILDDEKSH